MRMKNGAEVRNQREERRDRYSVYISYLIIIILLSLTFFYACGRKGNPIPPEDLPREKESYYRVSEFLQPLEV